MCFIIICDVSKAEEFGQGNEMSRLIELVNDCADDGVTFRQGKTDNEVKGDVGPWSTGGWMVVAEEEMQGVSYCSCFVHTLDRQKQNSSHAYACLFSKNII